MRGKLRVRPGSAEAMRLGGSVASIKKGASETRSRIDESMREIWQRVQELMWLLYAEPPSS